MGNGLMVAFRTVNIMVSIVVRSALTPEKGRAEIKGRCKFNANYFIFSEVF